MAKKKKEPIKKGRKKKEDPAVVQSIIFTSSWKLPEAKKWLKDNDFEPMGKVHITKKAGKKLGGSKKFTIVEADKFDKLGFKKTKQGISFLLGALKKVKKDKKE